MTYDPQGTQPLCSLGPGVENTLGLWGRGGLRVGWMEAQNCLELGKRPLFLKGNRTLGW